MTARGSAQSKLAELPDSGPNVWFMDSKESGTHIADHAARCVTDEAVAQVTAETLEMVKAEIENMVKAVCIEVRGMLDSLTGEGRMEAQEETGATDAEMNEQEKERIIEDVELATKAVVTEAVEKAKEAVEKKKDGEQAVRKLPSKSQLRSSFRTKARNAAGKWDVMKHALPSGLAHKAGKNDAA